ncbi:MAG: hypothetical protein COA85_07255 [Robiginitomaculum sp.]|nr:MAG: hypothetical protein COA85_07255 [Robiginitomaculum sp.]
MKNRSALTLFERLTGASGALHGLLAVMALASSSHLATGPGGAELLQRGGQIELFHALAVFAALCVGARLPALLFTLGAAAFALPLYLHGYADFTALGFLAPIGGLILLAGWGLLFCVLLLPLPKTA